MAKVTTIPELYQPLMKGVTIKSDRCCICGKIGVQMHHVVKRSAGNMYISGVRIHRPKLPLCGLGNSTGCHGLAHHNMLHFRWVEEYGNGNKFCDYTRLDSWVKGAADKGGHWEYLITDEPTKYQDALKMDGWMYLPSFGYNDY